MITLTITCNRCGKQIPSGEQHLEASYRVVNPHICSSQRSLLDLCCYRSTKWS